MPSVRSAWKSKIVNGPKRLRLLNGTKEEPQIHDQVFPKPPKISCDPSSTLDISELKALVDYAQKIIEYKPTTLRTKKCSKHVLKEACEVDQLPDGTPKLKALENIRTQMDFLISKFDALDGPNGLLANLELAVRGAIDTRLLIDYGDYLAYTKTLLQKQPAWMPHNKELFDDFERELDLDLEQLLNPSLPKSDTHRPLKYVLAWEETARGLGWSKEVVKFTINAYALRNRVCHSGLKLAVDKFDYASAAKRIVLDRRFLRENSTGEYQAMMLQCINIAARHYFRSEMLIGDVPHFVLQPEEQKRLDMEMAKPEHLEQIT